MNIKNLIKSRKDLGIKKYRLQKRGIVYFICENDGTIIYIGSTVNLQGRIHSHSMAVRFFHKPVFFLYIEKENCEALERKLIYQIKPKYNTQWINTKYKTISTKRQPTITEKESFRIKQTAIAIIKKKKITQTELAKVMNVSKQRISQILNDSVKLHGQTIKKLAKALGTISL